MSTSSRRERSCTSQVRMHRRPSPVAREQQRLQLVSSHLARSLAYEIWPGGAPRRAPCSAKQVGLATSGRKAIFLLAADFYLKKN